jgi:hypothetical protein
MHFFLKKIFKQNYFAFEEMINQKEIKREKENQTNVNCFLFLFYSSECS